MHVAGVFVIALVSKIGMNSCDQSAARSRIGSTPTHRNGTSVKYGRYLRELVKQTPVHSRQRDPAIGSPAAQSSRSAQLMYNAPMNPMHPFEQRQYSASNSWGEPLQFSAMSGNEVIQTVMNFGDFDTALLDLPLQEGNAFTWVDWMNPPEFGFQ